MNPMGGIGPGPGGEIIDIDSDLLPQTGGPS